MPMPCSRGANPRASDPEADVAWRGWISRIADRKTAELVKGLNNDSDEVQGHLRIDFVARDVNVNMCSKL